MYDMKDQINTLLSGISEAHVSYIHAQQMTSLPVITFCEYNNCEVERQGGKEYLSKIVIQIDLYESSGDHLSSLAATVNNLIYTTGLRRSYTRETYDSQTNLFHKSMLFKGIIQPDTGVVYQNYKEEK
ncbi:MAG TPA: hypothetical protein VHR42_03820 [Clostridia bacterium]|nr:hypothetical protein [Clostridia bacterium]